MFTNGVAKVAMTIVLTFTSITFYSSMFLNERDILSKQCLMWTGDLNKTSTIVIRFNWYI